jgi:signal transduction histidine kinase
MGLTIINDCPDTLPRVNGDRQWLREVLQNLLDNAIHYTPAGGRITVGAEPLNGEVRITVLDTGVGIDQTELERIFERFYRTEVARSLEAGGTGLGLAIAKHLVEVQHGRIEVESHFGQGSTFSVFMPQASPVTAGEKRPAEAPASDASESPSSNGEPSRMFHSD